MASLEEIKDFIYKTIKSTAGQKKWKPMDLHKLCIEKWGEDNYNKRKDGKKAMNDLVKEGKLVWTYFGGSFLEVPHKEGASND